MQPTLIKICCFSIIPIGIFILIKGIQLLSKTFNGKIISEIPYPTNTGALTINKDGYFSIWQKGQMFKRTPIDKFKLHIYKAFSKEEIKLHYSLLRPQTNNFATGRMEIYRFHAESGNYVIEFKEGSNISKLESTIGNIIPMQSTDLSKYSIQIRTSIPQILSFLAIPMLILGLFGIVGGFVLGLLSEQIFH